MLQILHLEDNFLDHELIIAHLLDGDLEFEVARVDSRAQFIQAIEQHCHDLILADYSLPSFDGLAALEIARENCADVPFILISGAIGEELAVESLRSGATDYILKHRLERLVPSIRRALRESEEREKTRRVEAALRQSEDRSRLIVEGVRDYAIFMTNLDGRVTSWNPGAERLFGYAESEVVGQLAEIIFTTEDRQNNVLERELKTAREQGRAADRRWHQRKDNSRFWADGSTTALYDGDGKTVTGFVKIMRDNTIVHLAEEERRQLLEQEKTARQNAEDANRLKDEFLATVSHELRTPLNAIYGWARILRTGNLDAAASGNAVEIIERNARAQIQLIEDLLDVSRMITGKLRLEIAPVEPVAVIKDAVDAVRPAAAAKQIEIETRFDQNAAVMFADPNRLQQIIWNLLSNAVKFTPVGGRVNVELRLVDSSVEIRISDTGIGISDDFLPFIFDRFRQAEQVTTRVHGGLGLGLAIVKNLIEMHGGKISASSAGENQGTTFTVVLPQNSAAVKNNHNGAVARKIEIEVASPQISHQNLPLTGLQILAVDDDEDSRELLKILLEQNGATVASAASAAHAMDLLRAGEFSVLVSDVGMPGEDGYELIQKVRALTPEQNGTIPAVALTGFARREDEERALRAGFDAHVTKPIEPGSLINKIVSIIQPQTAAAEKIIV